MIRVDPSSLPIVRQVLSDEIERLIGILDHLDGDADEEESDIPDDDAGDGREVDDDREPILGWTEGINQGAVSARYGDSWVWDEDEQ